MTEVQAGLNKHSDAVTDTDKSIQELESKDQKKIIDNLENWERRNNTGLKEIPDQGDIERQELLGKKNKKMLHSHKKELLKEGETISW